MQIQKYIYVIQIKNGIMISINASVSHKKVSSVQKRL